MLHSAASITFVGPTLAYVIIASRAAFDVLPGDAAEHDGLLSKTAQIGPLLVIFQWFVPKEEA